MFGAIARAAGEVGTLPNFGEHVLYTVLIGAGVGVWALSEIPEDSKWRPALVVATPLLIVLASAYTWYVRTH